MQRSCVILESAILTYQFKQIAQTTGIYAFERYVSSSNPDWESTAVAWVKSGIDPDRVAKAG